MFPFFFKLDLNLSHQISASIIQQMMEEMRSRRNPAPINQAQLQPLLRPQNWSQGSQAPQLGWGSPLNLTQSQSQTQN